MLGLSLNTFTNMLSQAMKKKMKHLPQTRPRIFHATSSLTSWSADCKTIFRGCRRGRASGLRFVFLRRRSGCRHLANARPLRPSVITCTWSEASTLMHARRSSLPKSLETKSSGRDYHTRALRQSKADSVIQPLPMAARSTFLADASCSIQSDRSVNAQTSFWSSIHMKSSCNSARRPDSLLVLGKTTARLFTKSPWLSMVDRLKVESFTTKW